MPFPPGVQTVTLTGHQTLADGDGRPLPVKIRPTPGRVVGAEWGVVVDNDPVVVTPDNAGQWTKTLVATDAAGFSPTGWTYRVETGGDAVFVSLPYSLGEVDLSELIPAGADGGEYVLVPGPPGAPGAAGASAYQAAVANGFVGTEAQWLLSLVGPQGAPGTAGAAGSPGAPGADGADGHTPQLYGGAGAPTTLHVDGDLYLRTNGDLYQQVAGAWGSPVGNLLGPQGATGPQGPAGANLRTALARVEDGVVADLPASTPWAVVTSSIGTQCKATINAVVGDRLRIEGDFLRSGGHFLDWAIIDGSGAILYFLTSRTSTAAPEGSPSMYPSPSFMYVQGAKQVVVQAGHLVGGQATVALVHRGTTTGRVYAAPGYPFELLLSNLGPEPA